MRAILSYSFVIPPTLFIVSGLIGSLVGFVRPRTGRLIALASSLLLYTFATPAMSTFLVARLEDSVTVQPDPVGAQAIVVLGGDMEYGDAAGAPPSVGPLTLERLATAARLYRRFQLPIVVSGGIADNSGVSLADLMRAELEQNFSVPVKWVEGRSKSTFQNARYTSTILLSHDITRVIIITQAWHMPRALWSFKKFGLTPLPYATFRPVSTIDLGMLFPTAKALLDSFYAIHEMIGLSYYKLVLSSNG